jgi:hypothetical protein
MTIKTSLLCGAAIGVALAMTAGAVAHAETTHKKTIHRRAAPSDAKMDAVLAEVRDLKASLATETAARLRLEAQIQQASAAAQSAQVQAQTAQAQVQTAQAQTTAVVQTIPTAVAEAVEKEKPKTDALYVKGLKITLGGFLETAEVYREHNTANDVSTALNTIPFPQSRQGHLAEYRFTPRQSRVSALIEGKPAPDITLGMYGEFDFQGAAQSANSNETNSYNPRIRHLYGTVDWAESGWHFLAGQTFSLVTLDAKGITPRNEVTPLTIDGQYHAGFVWARQPVIRVVKDLFDKTVWVAISAENPQTTFTGTVPAGVINTGQGFYAGATNTGAAATQSLNHIPDFVAKVAVEEDIAGHHVHGEVFGLARSFYEQLPDFKTNNLTTGAFGAGFIAQLIPGWLDVQASGLTGKGVGRYGSGQLPDATFNVNGHIEPITETLALVGATVHATKALDLWAYAGEEHDDRAAYGTIGYGNSGAVNTGCDIQASTLPCTGNTRLLGQISGGFWQRFYSGPWGHAQVGLQYSYIERDAFYGVGGAPIAHENLLYTSFRYYPFQ